MIPLFDLMIFNTKSTLAVLQLDLMMENSYFQSFIKKNIKTHKEN
jgi:hypothetical protein